MGEPEILAQNRDAWRKLVRPLCPTRGKDDRDNLPRPDVEITLITSATVTIGYRGGDHIIVKMATSMPRK
ncbi:hypothetical protein DPMN_168733, partial [Dreissena polymorpha]